MISYSKTNQGGSVRTYIIGAVILVLVVVLSINFVQQRGEQVRREEAISVADDMEQTSQPSSSEEKEANNPPTVSTSTGAGSASKESDKKEPVALPETGPNEVMQFAMLSLLSGLLVAYVKSRRVFSRTL